MDLSHRPTASKDGKRPSDAVNSAAQAASSLALLLREDRLLTEYELQVSGNPEESVFNYASKVLESEEATHHEVTQRATDALAEVNRKLALVESLAERVSRTSPEAVAGPLLRLHGYSLEASEDGDGSTHGNTATTTLSTARERSERVKRQGEVLEGVARRVEASLQRGLKRMEAVTSRLSRVLSLSATLKMILRLKFEASKLNGYDLDDARDLTRAAASVAVVEHLLSRPELKEGSIIDAVEEIRPEIWRTAAAVRAAAAKLLESHRKDSSSSPSSAVVQLGTTLQVYYHLGELPQAAWKAVDHALATAEKVSAQFFGADTISQIMENATSESRRTAGKSGDSNAQRIFKKKLRELRAAAAAKWASGITEAALQVWNLHRVLCRKTDPVGRLVYIDVVSAAEIPLSYQRHRGSQSELNIFSLFWLRLCSALADSIEGTLQRDNSKFAGDAAAFYPAVRSASLDMMGFLQDTMHAGVGTVSLDDGTLSSGGGILGGSSVLDDGCMGWSSRALETVATQATLGVASADTWTLNRGNGARISSSDDFISSASISLTAILQTSEWQAMEGNETTQKGLYPLQRAFQESSMERLCQPLLLMFPADMGIGLDDTGMAAAALPMLPSKYDVQKFDEIIRQELSLADPREGGGDLSAVKMIASSIREMVETFCKQANNVVCSPPDNSCLTSEGQCTDMMIHDMKITKILHTLTTYLRETPEKTFVEPYRPATTLQHEEAASICQAALIPAIREIEKMAAAVLSPLVRALNRSVAEKVARLNLGAYKEDRKGGAVEADGPSFVQNNLAKLFEEMAKNQLAKLPPEYASMVASRVTVFSIYTFVSSVALTRPIIESARLHITQDLSDLELILEQFVLKSGWSMSLSQIDGGKPYAELRAVRQMLFWSGLDIKEKGGAAIAKTLLRESWIKDVRLSTVCHFLFSSAPSLLSSPHHAKRMRAEDYVSSLVGLDATIEDGEAQAWMTIMACCDAYQQRESIGVEADGDPRVSRVLMTLGPELLRPRRH